MVIVIHDDSRADSPPCKENTCIYTSSCTKSYFCKLKLVLRDDRNNYPLTTCHHVKSFTFAQMFSQGLSVCMNEL